MLLNQKPDVLASPGGGGGGVVPVHMVRRNHPGHRTGAHATRVNHKGAHGTRGGAHDTHENHEGACNAHVPRAQRSSNWAPRTRKRGEAGSGRPGQHAEEWSNGASRTRKRGEACGGRPERGGEWAAKTIRRPPQP